MKYKIEIKSFSRPDEKLSMMVEQDVTAIDLCEEIVRYLDAKGNMPNLKREAEMAIKLMEEYRFRYIHYVDRFAHEYGVKTGEYIVGIDKYGGPKIALYWKSSILQGNLSEV